MALTERVEEDQIEIVGEYHQLQVRLATVIERDGVEIAREYSRAVLNPDDDISGRGELVQAVAGAVWTPEMRKAWASRQRPGVSAGAAGAPALVPGT